MTFPRTGASNSLVGSVHAVDGKAVVRMEDRFSTNPDDLWSAVTDPPRLARWIAKVDGDLRLGGEFRASFTSGWEGPGRVDVCEPPRRLLVTMSPGQDDQTVIEAELVADGDHTRLVLEERGLPLDEAAAHGAGWQAHVEDLAAYLAGMPTADWRTRWTELAPAYRDQQIRLG
ncbi:MAG TPA: SRPBCC family protein [Streptosporangiaceae bacterium]